HRDSGGRVGDPHCWDQLYLERIRYVDYGQDRTHPLYLVTVAFEYEDRPDPFSDRRAGFEIRTPLRCARILVRSEAGVARQIRPYELDYVDQLRDAGPTPPNGVSLLARLRVVGHDGNNSESMPPLDFSYSGFEPAKRSFFPVQGDALPARSLTNPDLELV